jgi:hypothetical protein
MVGLLLSLGASASVPNDDGITAAVIAEEKGHTTTV